MAGEDLSFTLAWADIDPEVLPADAREAGTEAFRREVTAFLGRAYESVGGKVRVVFDDAQRLLDVHWAAPSDIASLEREPLRR